MVGLSYLEIAETCACEGRATVAFLGIMLFFYKVTVLLRLFSLEFLIIFLDCSIIFSMLSMERLISWMFSCILLTKLFLNGPLTVSA